MARSIKLSQIGSYAEEKLEKLLRVVVLETDRKLKEASPVDLGRFRMSWAIGENDTPFDGVPPGDYRGNPVPPPKRIGYANERVGNVYHIHNNLPYAEKLATAPGGSGIADEKRYNPNRTVKNWATPGGGSSNQTNGPGWIDLIAREMTDFARRTADQIGRQD